MLLRSKRFFTLALLMNLVANLLCTKVQAQNDTGIHALHTLFDNYYEEYVQLNPLDATFRGDFRYNDKLPNDGTVSYLKALHDFYNKYQTALQQITYQKLNEQDKISYDILRFIIDRELKGVKFHPEYLPITQFGSLPSTMGQLGSGTGAQPFKTIKDYEDWLKRIAAFADWTDTAIANIRKGAKTGVTLPKALVLKIIPQMESLGEPDSSKSIFYGPVRNFPTTFAETDKTRLTAKYYTAINQQLLPAYQKLKNFFSMEYLAAARTSSGINVLPDGDEMYRYYVYSFTTLRKSPEEIYQTGLNEVARITKAMEKIKDSIGFKGSLKELFEYMKTNPQFMPFKTDDEVLNAYRGILGKIQPHLKDLFGVFPKAPFEIRAVEKYRAAAASPQYQRGSPDGNRPGIFYVPIVDPTKINVTGWAMESVFLHEAIPGHHYQLSLQQENTTLPLFRRFPSLPAFTEGWGLYVESLGKQLGCYTDPYQELGALGTEMHRAIRLVVDVSIHTGKMTREDAIHYMMDNEALSEQVATAEIERYMARPGQALSYKTGELKIKLLRDKYEKQLGTNFSLKHFHDAILIGGAMPLDVFERYMDNWATKQKANE
ncbi:DUF885 domain-containing protein [Pinibacter soli]|uniref:DUF885 domain-containing protein n=1 Tax=Pinibacter soli TaxID=3044211 RepID=A0ABT6RAN9_9BACT|nr:DUF885 domain-containing protein [Pinibacter soli]MDI3319470.1 DUF885 domain-containing protein [Pinibacter soli]